MAVDFWTDPSYTVSSWSISRAIPSYYSMSLIMSQYEVVTIAWCRSVSHVTSFWMLIPRLKIGRNQTWQTCQLWFPPRTFTPKINDFSISRWAPLIRSSSLRKAYSDFRKKEILLLTTLIGPLYDPAHLQFWGCWTNLYSSGSFPNRQRMYLVSFQQQIFVEQEIRLQRI